MLTAPNSAPIIPLDAAELRLLSTLRLNPRKTFTGRVRGERISRQKGVSLEFADYRDYTDGDDLRHLDWSVLARLERPTIRTYQDEDDLAVYIALDVSASMDFGNPTKFAHASRLGSALGLVGLVGQDAVYPIALGTGDPQPGRPLRGRAAQRPLDDWLAAQKPNGSRGLAQSLSRFTVSRARPGLFLCLSDGLDPAVPDALRSLGARGHEVALIQTLSDLDLDPDLEGDLRLIDSETGAAVEVTAHAQALRQYRQNLDAHCRRLEESVLRVGGRFIRTVAGEPIANFIAQARRVGLVP